MNVVVIDDLSSSLRQGIPEKPCRSKGACGALRGALVPVSGVPTSVNTRAVPPAAGGGIRHRCLLIGARWEKAGNLKL